MGARGEGRGPRDEESRVRGTWHFNPTCIVVFLTYQVFIYISSKGFSLGAQLSAGPKK